MLVSSRKQVLFFVSFDASEFNPPTLQASLTFFIDHSFSFESDDEPDKWSPDAKLKLVLRL